MDMEQKKRRYLEKIKQLRLMDDTFFNTCFDGNIPCMEVVLRAIMGNDRLRVTEVITQQSVPNLYGRAVDSTHLRPMARPFTMWRYNAATRGQFHVERGSTAA